MKNRRATFLQVTEIVNAGRDQTVLARTVPQQFHREAYYSRAAVYKPSKLLAVVYRDVDKSDVVR